MNPIALALLATLATAADTAGSSQTVNPDADETPAADPRVASLPLGGAARPLVPRNGRPPAPPTVERADDRRPARASALGIVLELRSDFGLERMLEVEYSNDRRVTMSMNDGLAIAAGVSFLPLAGGRFGTRISAGVKLDRIRAMNGNALFMAFPVDLMEAAYVGPFRFGAGPSVLLGPRITGKGILDQERVAFAPAPGAVLDAEWLVSARARTGIGVRASWYRFASGSSVRGAPSIGLVMRADFDLAGR